MVAFVLLAGTISGPRSMGDTVRGVEENLLKMTRQVAVPYQACCCGQRGLFEADGNHVVAVRRLVTLGQSACPHSVPGSGQHRGRPASFQVTALQAKAMMLCPAWRLQRMAGSMA